MRKSNRCRIARLLAVRPRLLDEKRGARSDEVVGPGGGYVQLQKEMEDPKGPDVTFVTVAKPATPAKPQASQATILQTDTGFSM